MKSLVIYFARLFFYLTLRKEGGHLMNQLNVPYRVLLPRWVLTANTEKEYLKRCYPDRIFLKIEGDFAICQKPSP